MFCEKWDLFPLLTDWYLFCLDTVFWIYFRPTSQRSSATRVRPSFRRCVGAYSKPSAFVSYKLFLLSNHFLSIFVSFTRISTLDKQLCFNSQLLRKPFSSTLLPILSRPETASSGSPTPSDLLASTLLSARTFYSLSPTLFIMAPKWLFSSNSWITSTPLAPNNSASFSSGLTMLSLTLTTKTTSRLRAPRPKLFLLVFVTSSHSGWRQCRSSSIEGKVLRQLLSDLEQPLNLDFDLWERERGIVALFGLLILGIGLWYIPISMDVFSLVPLMSLLPFSILCSLI